MSRQKKTRKISDIMPARKADKPAGLPRKSSRYELDAKAREEKRKKKRKGLPSGSRHSVSQSNGKQQSAVVRDPRVGSRKKIPLMVEFVNKPEKGQLIPPVREEKPTALDPMAELTALENNECLNVLLDQLDAGKTLSAADQTFVDECLARIDELMQTLGLAEEDDEEDDLLKRFSQVDINQFR
ncbi:Der GTPase-activating protein YihI [Pasteurellaceae bacterium HPA106]|uniref:Der GTPase-activating protein YihI n=1 Tax=Spirabiliibacterium pneumoniae TaxID=221400 RepID=UPI001AAC9ECE|nr:Der GTPase-activating protein YihI [Spirabiliibacterium pneumoniae]MBE2897163.1 Der GTPase-activating protein YihI [Spirabiliibacterium pneumoniae]